MMTVVWAATLVRASRTMIRFNNVLVKRACTRTIAPSSLYAHRCLIGLRDLVIGGIRARLVHDIHDLTLVLAHRRVKVREQRERREDRRKEHVSAAHKHARRPTRHSAALVVRLSVLAAATAAAAVD
jgi:hypothetical protein